MQNRCYRRWKETIKVIQRIKRIRRVCYMHYTDSNGIKIQHPTWMDYIGTESHFMYKTYTTSRYDTRYKSKWGKGGRRRYKDGMYRAKDTHQFRKMLQNELNIKLR